MIAPLAAVTGDRITVVSTPIDRERMAAGLARAFGGMFQPVRPIGRGGMGTVWLARDVVLHRVVAIKVIARDGADADAVERVRREARLAAQLAHPGIVPVHAFADSDDAAYIVMPYINGESLGARLRRNARMEPDQVRTLLRDLADVLSYAHAQGVVHRDLKPDNVLLEEEHGRTLLADFGVATRPWWEPGPDSSRYAFGTPHFMSPEQAAGDVDLDGRSDIYALGVLGYLMLSGRTPATGMNTTQVLAHVLARSHEPLSQVAPRAPRDLVRVIESCLAKSRDQRPRRAAEIRDALSGRSMLRRVLAV